MIVDSSAVIAILRAEPGAARYARALEETQNCRISAANWLEAAIVISNPSDPLPSRGFDEFVRDTALVVEPVTVRQAQLAREAYRDFGKDSGHPARLNFGDCFAYALATDTGEPSLFKGDDFTHTDLKSAIEQ